MPQNQLRLDTFMIKSKSYSNINQPVKDDYAFLHTSGHDGSRFNDNRASGFLA